MTAKPFSTTFRIKLESLVRLLQQHVTSQQKKFGPIMAQPIQDDLFADLLTTLYAIREDDTVSYGIPDQKEWEVYTKIVTDELNKMNENVSRLFSSQIPTTLILGKVNIEMAITCDRIVDLLNAETMFLKSTSEA